MPRTSRTRTWLWVAVALLWLAIGIDLYRAFNGYLSHTGQLLPFLGEVGMAGGAGYIAYVNHTRGQAVRRTATAYGAVSLIYALMLSGVLPGFGLRPYLFPLGPFGIVLPFLTSAYAFVTAARSVPQDPSEEIPHKVRDSF